MHNRLKELRTQLKMTQNEFANKLGTGRNNIAKYETGVNEPSNAVVSLICRQFDVNEEWLRTGKGDMYVKVDKEVQLMKWAGNVLKESDESFKKRFVKMLMELDESDWESLEKMALLLHGKD